ncbi:MAG: hypothetical protein JW927_07830 [Deltaproteobacteria bacterium]|nr:hypothetical protein [Deltaproteobacteria bacterium]
MIYIQNILSFARVETRLTRRLVRYWFFISTSYLITIILFLFYSGLHGVYSSYSATAAPFNPRFLVGTIGLYYLLIYITGTVFLAFDVRARDLREHMTDVLDSRPYTNLELVSGRFLGLLLCSFVPIVVLTIILEFLGLLLPLPFGDTIEIYSLIAFLGSMAFPALAFVLSLVFLVTLLVRNRLMAAVILLVLIGGDFWAIFNLPLAYSPLFDLTGSLIINTPSDIIPSMAGLAGWMQRFGVLVSALGMLVLSGAVHPRLDDGSRGSLAASGAGLLILAMTMTGFGFYQNINTINMIEKWKKAHSAHVNAPVADIRNISGEVMIDPGKTLDLELDLTFRAPDNEQLRSVIFTLNPGQKIKQASDASGHPLSFTHENGLLELKLTRPLDPGEETVIHLSIQGLPDCRFGYLESAIKTENLKATQKDLTMLGLDRYIFDSRFVALMPGIRWLPSSGSEKERDDPRRRSIDFYNVNLIVNLPSGWLVAGPGRRDEVEAKGDRVKYSFSPNAPVPEVALIASRFKSLPLEVEGVMMEMLIHPKHMKNIELLADTGKIIKTWSNERLRETKENGLGYPYNGLTLVEVPNSLRGYGGGWRMDTTMAPPGLLLMREGSFPTARFEWPFRNPENYKDREGGLTQAKWESLLTFFNNDLSGGNILSGTSRNFFIYQTSARGPEAIALNYVMETLSARLVTDNNAYFSAHNFADEDIMGPIMKALFLSRYNESSLKKSMTDAAIDMITSDPKVWDQALKSSLKDIEPWDDPALQINVLTLKAGAMARCILDILGREKTAHLLSSIRETHKGGTFSFDDMNDKGRALGIDFKELFGDWLGSISLPGFIVSSSEVYRLPDSENGMPRYQLLISVSNDEQVPGVFRFQYRVRAGEKQDWSKSDPIRIDGKHAIRFGMVLFQPPEDILLEPYISLNRGSFKIPLQTVDHDKIVDVKGIEGVEEIPWSSPDNPFFVVDNLDEGFEVLEGVEKKDILNGSRGAGINLSDKGFTAWTSYFPSSEWTNLDLPGSWGKYQHTTAVVKAGEGTKKAIFTGVIHKRASWGLWLHMPEKKSSFPGSKFGTWNLVVKDSVGDQHEIQFHSDAALQGWNQVETLNLPEGVVSVTISDKTDGDLVLADAMRWSPSDGE